MYDRVEHRIVGHMRQVGTNRPNWVSTSPLGNYVVISWYGSAASSLAAEAARPLSSAAGVRAYTPDFSMERKLVFTFLVFLLIVLDG